MEQKDNLVPELEDVDLQPVPQEEQEEVSLDLDEILKEFSGPVEEDPVEQLARLEENTPIQEDTIRFEPTPEPLKDTVEFEPVSEEAAAAQRVSSDTVEFEPVEQPAAVTDDTRQFEPVSGSEETVEEMDRKDRERLEELQKPTGEEPFSEKWEPEYEQPMGEYVPEPAIIYHPRSRLKELKRKLIEGPEKRYYALQDQGFGKLYFAIFLCILTVITSVGISVLSGAGLILENRPKLMVFSQLFLMLMAALLGSYQLLEGLTDLLKGKFTLATMLVLSFIACCADAVICLGTLRMPCCAAFSLQVLLAMCRTAQKRSTEMGVMDTMRKAVRLDRLAAQKDYYEGKTGFLRGDGQVEDVMDTYYTTSAPERFQNICALITLLLSLALAVLAYIRYGISTAVQVLSVGLLAGVPAVSYISMSRPMAILEKRMHKLGAVLCGWRGVKGMKTKALLVVDHRDLFPDGMVKMNGVKFFGSRDTDEIVAYAAALVCADGGGLAPLFEQVLESRNGRHYQVEALRSYDNGGIGGEVCGEPVLVGMLPFLKDMGVEIPDGLRVDQAVYVAIDGELCGLFALSYERAGAVAEAMRTVCGCMGLKLLLTNMDFMLTKSFLRAKFGIRPKKLLIPGYEQCRVLRDKTPDEDALPLLVTTKEGLGPVAFGVTGGRALHTAGWMGAVLQLLAGLVGLGIVAVLVLKGGMHMLTPDNLFLLQFAWLIPGILIAEWTRTI